MISRLLPTTDRRLNGFLAFRDLPSDLNICNTSSVMSRSPSSKITFEGYDSPSPFGTEATISTCSAVRSVNREEEGIDDEAEEEEEGGKGT